MIKKEFTAAADGTRAKPENGPDPAKVAEVGIKTPGSLAYLARQHPEPPTQRYEIDQEALRRAALTQERARAAERIENMRQHLRARPEKARRDFGTARDYRGAEHER